ncbi:hypothetical protein [Sphingomonas sp. CFBP9021]|uniref:hypothetical protein n=1 Tax=Sphingomonas sp. CFBP9021 TaxID=3096534 RepID=UPI002A6ACC30|nr:hypothetical protein [Sphingomonas sp. CFBP9021]MDY0969066.1 hypothetical protein [Sphingomonas sp. CFBP9021]
MIDEEPKRLAHSKEVLRELFAKSGNVCAYPGCRAMMIDKKGLFVGQVCHISGVRGERFNQLMSNEQRAAAANLILMCYPHHVETNDVTAFPVERLTRMKDDHEALFSDPGMRLYKAYVDQSARKGLRQATTAQRFCRVLGWQQTPVEAQETADDINLVGEKLAKLDVQSRLFLCAVVERAHFVRHTANVRSMGHLWLRWDEFTANYLENDTEVHQRLTALEAHRLGRKDQLDLGDYEVPAILLYQTPNGGWDLWSAIAEFCEASGEPLEMILVDLQFDRLD